jgi:uncharacterized protein YggE
MVRQALLTAALLLAAQGPWSPAGAQTRFIDVNPERAVEVTGEASVEVKPDFARVTLGVSSAARDASAAMAQNAKAANALIAALKADGVPAADLQTSNLSVSPTYSAPSPGSMTPPTITGYTVSNTVTVTIRDLSKFGALLDKAVAAGSNTVYGIAFGENDESALLDKARPLAVADAKRKAEIYAAAGGARIGRLMELSEQVSAPQPMARRMYAQAASAAPTPIEPGQDKLTVTVNARFELTQ